MDTVGKALIMVHFEKSCSLCVTSFFRVISDQNTRIDTVRINYVFVFIHYSFIVAHYYIGLDSLVTYSLFMVFMVRPRFYKYSTLILDSIRITTPSITLLRNPRLLYSLATTDDKSGIITINTYLVPYCPFHR